MARRWTGVAETASFKASASGILSDADIRDLITVLAQDPERGDVVPGTGGLRKIRVARGGKGKSGGARVIYYYYDETVPVFLLLAYAKARQDNPTPEQTRVLKALAAAIKSQAKKQ